MRSCKLWRCSWRVQLLRCSRRREFGSTTKPRPSTARQPLITVYLRGVHGRHPHSYGLTTGPEVRRHASTEVEWHIRVRYLGVQIDRSMRMAAQVEHVIHQSRTTRSMLRPVLQSHLSLQVKIAQYKCYIRSRLTCAASAWYALCSTLQRKRIQTQQNIALRMIMGGGQYVLNDVIARDLRMETVK
ncbi:hypothetical protein EVAR_18190_1 [Eumeta japonica]|uniref:RNA-directed DNA polymerase from mobile element jockey n=1 Tax=Eumeta variegata TaxID=151549 RepID=A0A4C1UV75_EUMVA|nr:hypothetical protein EVAR_18190_1 [Eumeta japonica]